jgi:inositol 3-alpha-galactosyltransferase
VLTNRLSNFLQFVEYERMVYLDGDIQVYNNIDDLFELEKGSFYAVMDCFCEKTWSHTPQYKIGYCQQCPDRVAWPAAKLGPPPALYFNAGMFVHEPSMETAKALLDTLRVTPPTPFAEQDFLNMFFRDQYKPVPNVYNLVLAMLWRHPENVKLEMIKIVHYCAAVSGFTYRSWSVSSDSSVVLCSCSLIARAWMQGSKPWRYTVKEVNMDREDINMLVKKWWDVYNDETLDFNGLPDMPADEVEAVVKKPLHTALAEAGTVKYDTAPSAA